MTKDQILADFAFLYQRALEEGNWTLAVQIKTTQAKIMGVFIPWLEQSPNSREAAAKEQILADFAFLYQRVTEASKWNLGFRIRTMQARILGFFIHKRPKASTSAMPPQSSKPKALQPTLPEPRLPQPQSSEPELSEAPESKLAEEISPESKLLKLFTPSYHILEDKAKRQKSCRNRKERRKAKANKQRKRAA